MHEWFGIHHKGTHQKPEVDYILKSNDNDNNVKPLECQLDKNQNNLKSLNSTAAVAAFFSFTQIHFTDQSQFQLNKGLNLIYLQWQICISLYGDEVPIPHLLLHAASNLITFESDVCNHFFHHQLTAVKRRSVNDFFFSL